MVNPTGLRGLACLTLLVLLSVTRSWGQTAQTITFGAPASRTIFAPASFTVSATASSGLTVSFASTTTGVCTMPGPTIVSTVATGTCTIKATQAGNGAYAAAAPVSQSFTVVRASPSGALTAVPGSPFAAGSNSVSVAVGDFNGDGKPDFATANTGDNTVTVFLGDGSGGFTTAPGSPFGVGSGPFSVAVGDFNGDGKLDLATANPNSNNVTVLLGNGSGGFTAAPGSPFAVGTLPNSIVVADFNGDGRLDLATANLYSNDVTVLLGNGSGGFTAAPGSPFGTGTGSGMQTGPFGVAAGDFNGDGKLDLATANYNSSSNVTVLLGNGLGGFTAAAGSPFFVGNDPLSVAVGDFNGDGKLDLATANYGGNVAVLLGNGSGGFTAAPGSPFAAAAGSTPKWVAVGDFNGDGKLDLATADGGGDSITVLLGDGSGGFTAAPGSPFGAGGNPNTVAVGDFNGDGKLDLVAANYDSSDVTVLLGGLAATSATLSTTAASSITYGTAVPLKLTVAVPAANALSTPSGTATFLDGGTTLGTNGPTGSPYTFTPATLSAGTHTLTATYGGDTRNNSSSSNTVTITVTKATQTITLGSAPSPAVYNTSVTVSATATSGLPVTLSSATPSECIVSGATVRLIAVGTCTIDADQPGNSNYSAALQNRLVFLVTPAPQTIAFGSAPSPAFYNTSVTVSATATSGLAVTFTSATPSVCTVSGATARLIALGTCTINANQAGNSNYSVAPQTSQNFLVTQAPQTITFGAASGLKFVGQSFTMSVTASSGLPVSLVSTTLGVCTVSGTTASPLAAGTCTVRASEAGNADYSATSATQNFTIAQASPSGALTASPGSPFAVGSDPVSVAVGDFNGDGKPDVAIANNGSNNLTVLMGDGSGGFTAAPGSPFGVGSGPVSVAVGDFNGDGKLDLATANSNSNNVTILLGDGSGGFTAAAGSPFAAGNTPNSIVVGDFNGDGKLDLATANIFSNDVTVLLGDGSGGFTAAPASPFRTETGPVRVAAGDFNGDGKLDLATANYNSSSNVTVLLGNGSGGFTAAPGSPFAVGNDPLSVAVGDFNGDGKLDLATANYSGDNVTVLLGNGSGGFSAAPGSPFAVGSNPRWVAVGDFNGDGMLDLATANGGSSNISVLLGNGSGGFAAAPGSPLGAGGNTNTVAVGDFNGDGRLDLVAANYDTSTPKTSSSNVTVLLGGLATTSATLSTTAASSILYGTPVPLTFRVGLAVGVLPEQYAISTSTPSGTATFLDGGITLGTAAQTGSPYTFTPATLSAGTHNLTATYGGDARYSPSSSDTVVTINVTKASQTITFGSAPSPTVYSTSVTVSATATSGLPVTFSSATPSVCTVSGATATLIAVGTCTINATQAGNSNYSAAPQTSQSFLVTQATQTITFGAAAGLKFVGQSLTMSVTASSGLPVSLVSTTLGVCTVAGTTASVLAKGACTVRASQAGNADYGATSATQTFTVVPPGVSGALAASPGSPFAVGSDPVSAAVGDFNGDGKPDVATANYGSNNVTVLLGDGSGRFTAAPGSPFGVGSGPFSVAVGDFNGDGKLDLATANNSSSNVTVLLGDGSGGFTAAPGSPFAVGSGPNSIAAGDFNGDGKLDLATSSPGSNNVTVLLGNGSGGFTVAPGSPFTVGSRPASVAVSDFNGDGKLDLATPNYGSNNVTVLLGNGSGGFTAAVGSPFAVGSGPLSAAVADFNGDGKPDLATSNNFSNDVSVLLGDGSGGFTAAAGSPFAVGRNPYSVATGDFDGDGKPDLAASNYNSNNITVMLGDGSGGFTAAPGSPFGTGTNPYAVAVGDFNGDGRLDLVTPNYVGGNVTVLLGGLATTNAALSTTAASSIAYGSVVPLTLTVGVPSANALSMPSGTATFLDGGTTLGTAAQTGSPYTFTAATLSVGSHMLTAVYGGDTRNNSSSSNTVKITVMPGQTIRFGVLSNRTFGAGPFTLSAIGGPSGNPVVFNSTTPGVCIVNGANVTILGAGTCSIQANQAGNATYAAAVTVSQSFTVYQASQTITFGVLSNQTFGAGPFTVSAIGGASGNAVTFSSATTGVCVIGGATVTIVGVGTCTIQASQAGNANYSAAPAASQSFTVAQGTQTITFAQPSSPQTPTDSVALTATASSGLPVTLSSQTPSICSVSGSSALLMSAGACSILASQAGNAMYAPAAPVVRSFSFAAVPLTATPTSLSFNFLPAAGSVLPQSLAVGPSVPGTMGTTIPYNVSASSTWITVNPSSGKTPASVTIGVNPAGLIPGKTYSGTVTFGSPFGTPATVSVMLSIDPSAPIAPSMSQIAFPSSDGSPATQSTMLNGADGFQVPFTVSFAGSQPTLLSNPPFRRESAHDAPPSSFVSFTPSQGTTPAVVNLTTSSLVAGYMYSGTLTITPTNSTSMPLSIPVSVAVPAPPLKLTVAPSSVALTVTQGSQASSSVEIETSGGSGTTLTYTVAPMSAVNGLSAGPASGSLAIGGSQPIQILLDATNLAPGTYPSALQVTVKDAVNQSQTQLVPVSVIVTAAPATLQPRLNLNFQGISFTERAGNGNSVPQTISVLNAGAGTLNWNAFVLSTQSSWLVINSGIGKSTPSNPSGLTVGLNPLAVAALTIGSYSASVNVVNSDNPGDSQLLTVELVVTDPSMVPPDAIPLPVGLVFTAQNGANPASQNVTVYTSSSAPVALTAGVEINDAAVSSPWLSVASCGSTDDFSSVMVSTDKPACLTVSVNIAGVAPGVYRGAVTLGVTSGMGNAQTTVSRVVAVTLIVAPGAAGPSGSARGTAPRAAGQSCVPTRLVPTFVGGLPGNFNGYATANVAIEVQVVDDCGNIVPLPGTLDPSVSVTISSNQQQPPAGTMRNNDPVNSRYTYQFTPSDAANNAIVTVSASRTGLIHRICPGLFMLDQRDRDSE